MEDSWQELRMYVRRKVRAWQEGTQECIAARMYAERYAFFGKEAEAAHTRACHLIMLIERERSVYLGGGLHQLIEARRACPMHSTSEIRARTGQACHNVPRRVEPRPPPICL